MSNKLVNIDNSCSSNKVSLNTTSASSINCLNPDNLIENGENPILTNEAPFKYATALTSAHIKDGVVLGPEAPAAINELWSSKRVKNYALWVKAEGSQGLTDHNANLAAHPFFDNITVASNIVSGTQKIMLSNAVNESFIRVFGYTNSVATDATSNHDNEKLTISRYTVDGSRGSLADFNVYSNKATIHCDDFNVEGLYATFKNTGGVFDVASATFNVAATGSIDLITPTFNLDVTGVLKLNDFTQLNIIGDKATFSLAQEFILNTPNANSTFSAKKIVLSAENIDLDANGNLSSISSVAIGAGDKIVHIAELDGTVAPSGGPNWFRGVCRTGVNNVEQLVNDEIGPYSISNNASDTAVSNRVLHNILTKTTVPVLRLAYAGRGSKDLFHFNVAAGVEAGEYGEASAPLKFLKNPPGISKTSDFLNSPDIYITDTIIAGGKVAEAVRFRKKGYYKIRLAVIYLKTASEDDVVYGFIERKNLSFTSNAFLIDYPDTPDATKGDGYFITTESLLSHSGGSRYDKKEMNGIVKISDIAESTGDAYFFYLYSASSNQSCKLDIEVTFISSLEE